MTFPMAEVRSATERKATVFIIAMERPVCSAGFISLAMDHGMTRAPAEKPSPDRSNARLRGASGDGEKTSTAHRNVCARVKRQSGFFQLLHMSDSLPAATAPAMTPAAMRVMSAAPSIPWTAFRYEIPHVPDMARKQAWLAR